MNKLLEHFMIVSLNCEVRIVSFSFRYVVHPTTIKHQSFVSLPMGTIKPVTALPGIGRVWGGQLTENGIGRAAQLFGQYLVLEQDGERFTDWLRQKCGIGVKRSWCVYSALHEWNQQYFL